MIKRIFRLSFPYRSKKSHGDVSFVFVRPDQKKYRAIVKRVVDQHREALEALRDR